MKNSIFYNKIKYLVVLALTLFVTVCLSISFCLFNQTKLTFAETGTQTNFTAVAHYKFDDTTNLGKDSLGNHNLTNKGGVVVDTVNGGAKIGSGTNGYLYTPESRTNDFSDRLTGSYSVSLRVYLQEVNGGSNVITSTSNAWAGKFDLRYAYTNIRLNIGSAISDQVIYSTLSATPAWYRITLIYDETSLTYTSSVLKDGETTAVEKSWDLTSAITFGSDNWGLFAIGGRTADGTSYTEEANCDGFIPSICDYRIYEGAIDANEIASIKSYDENYEFSGGIGGEEGGDDTEEGFTKVAHYEFKDEDNLGKDSLGKNDLIATNGVRKDKVHGGVMLGANNGILYAPVDENGKDFSDYLTGSYSVSMRAYLRQVNGGANYLLTTGRYGSNFQVDWSSCGLSINLNSSTLLSFGTSTTAIGGAALFDTTFAWYRITMIYNQNENTFRVKVLREDNPLYSYDWTRTISSKVTFGGNADYTFTVGAQSKAGKSIEQLASANWNAGATIYPSISDIRIYSGVIDETEIEQINTYDTENQKLKLNGVFGDNMLLQRGKPVKIWGYGGTVGQTVKVSFNGQEKQGKVYSQGWEVYLDPMQALTTGKDLIVTCGKQTVNVKNVIVGELLYCSGQSNIDITLDYISKKYANIYNDYSLYNNFSKVRFYKPTWCGKDSAEIYTSPYSTWQTPTTAQDLKYVSAYAAGLALNLQAMLGDNVPVAVIETSTGGSCIEEWLSAENLSAQSSHISSHGLTPSIYYNGQVNYLKGLTVGGVFWYQGERCIDFTESYKELLKTLICQYREDFNDQDLPIYLMQLPQINISVAYGNESYGAKWVEMRNTQESVANEVNGVYAVCLIDTGDTTTHSDCIHPSDKWAVTHRSAGAYVATALKISYDKLAVKGDYGLSPKVVSATAKNGVITLTVENATSLTVNGTIVNGFKGKLANGSEVDLTFTIDGNTLKCTTTEEVVSISYMQVASSENALVFNEYGVPLMPIKNIIVTEETFINGYNNLNDNDISNDMFNGNGGNNNQNQNTTQNGCNGSLSSSMVILPLCLAGIVLLKKRKN